MYIDERHTCHICKYQLLCPIELLGRIVVHFQTDMISIRHIYLIIQYPPQLVMCDKASKPLHRKKNHKNVVSRSDEIYYLQNNSGIHIFIFSNLNFVIILKKFHNYFFGLKMALNTIKQTNHNSVTHVRPSLFVSHSLIFFLPA